MTGRDLRVVALAGGVGGAKLAWGLSQVLQPSRLTVVANTGDDEVFYGLHVSPDLDTLMYTLAGLADPDRGWGLAGDTFQALDMLGRYGEATWFNLGDRDLATHVLRTQMLNEGKSLSEVTERLARGLGVQCRLIPMADEPVRTVIHTDEGDLPMQTYFVGRGCEPKATGVTYRGADRASMPTGFSHAIRNADALVYCPSNPMLSLDPILAVPGVKEAVRQFQGPRVAVSPIVGGQALRGPAAKLLAELGEEVSPVGIARRMVGLCDVLVIDRADERLAASVSETGVKAVVRDTIMHTPEDKVGLARETCAIIQEMLP